MDVVEVYLDESISAIFVYEYETMIGDTQERSSRKVWRREIKDTLPDKIFSVDLVQMGNSDRSTIPRSKTLFRLCLIGSSRARGRLAGSWSLLRGVIQDMEVEQIWLSLDWTLTVRIVWTNLGS